MEKPSLKIHAFLAHAGILSRRAAERAVTDGRVTINGQRAVIGQRVTADDRVRFDGKPVIHASQQKRYFLVHKPLGVVSTTSDELGRPNVLSLLPPVSERLYPVGRLDVDSEGLLLITNDGELANKMTHPRYQVKKTYRVTVLGIPTEAAINHLERGVRLKEGYTNPAFTENLFTDHDAQKTTFDITISQGWNRQVRRMCERVGYEVVKLVRVRFGQFTLQQLQGRQWMELSNSPSLSVTE